MENELRKEYIRKGYIVPAKKLGYTPLVKKDGVWIIPAHYS